MSFHSWNSLSRTISEQVVPSTTFGLQERLLRSQLPGARVRGQTGSETHGALAGTEE